LVVALYVDDTLCDGTREEIDWICKMIITKFNIEKIGQLRKHLGILWNWNTADKREVSMTASIRQIIEETEETFMTATNQHSQCA
jgi:hypothetical protein